MGMNSAERKDKIIANAKVQMQNLKLATQNAERVKTLAPIQVEGKYGEALRRLNDIELQIKSENIIEKSEARIPIDQPFGLKSMNELQNEASEIKFQITALELQLKLEFEWTKEDINKAKIKALNKRQYEYYTI